MPDDPKAPPGQPLVRVFAALAVLAVLAWFVAGFYGCKHAGLL